MNTKNQATPLAFFKALADGNRLKIIGLLSQQEYTVEQLAAILNLQPSTVSHHLSRLARAGLVSARAESYYNLYRLEKSAWNAMAQQLLNPAALAAVEADTSAYDHKVLHDYLLPDGRLKTIPAQRKKLGVILRHLCSFFEPGKRYSEQEVNQILRRFHPDTASLRREMVGYHFLQREKGMYWRIDQTSTNEDSQE